MTDDIKPCPFCGQKAEVQSDDELTLVMCSSENCESDAWLTPDDWNTRPIEDALRARIAELEAQLAAVPQWTRITDDRTSWPGYYETTLVSTLHKPTHSRIGPLWIVKWVKADPRYYKGLYWLPITPPEYKP